MRHEVGTMFGPSMLRVRPQHCQPQDRPLSVVAARVFKIETARVRATVTWSARSAQQQP